MDITKRAGFWWRVLATLIDLVFLIPLVALLGVALAYLDSKDALTPARETGVGLVFSIGMVIYSSLEVFKAGTPGKLVLGMRIVAADGSPASTAMLWKRYAIKQIPSVAEIVTAVTTVHSPLTYWAVTAAFDLAFLAGCLMAARRSRQAAWDQWLGTAVARRKTRQDVEGFAPLMTVPLTPDPHREG